ncbi:MAG: GTPase ObgE [bacterium]|nr:GTPase ObgE [bacterium]
MIIDEVIIQVEAGSGGDGHVSLRREKYVPKGGPDGGDGGKGGNIYFKPNPSLNTLTNYAAKKYYKAQDGAPGGKALKTGKNGEDQILEVPPGTIITNSASDQKIADIINETNNVLVAKGGRGGWGNYHFRSATNQTPREFNPGQPGKKMDLRLELKLIADVGLIGLPNAGKSTLLSRISKARPKVADYPFTTIEPVLGVASYHSQTFVAADIPGLIEGASRGRGLGHKFLKHIERTKILAHLIDINEPDILASYQVIRGELKEYSPSLAQKPEIIVLSKMDTLSNTDRQSELSRAKKSLPKLPILMLSAVSGEGIDGFLKIICNTITK